MKILHTSDWHLGAPLGPEKRSEEFEAALNWLIRLLAEEGIEAVIIAGDVFDSGLPPNSAAKLYYRFLAEAHAAGVRSMIVTAGNHDSAGFLEAPKEILGPLHVKVIGKPAAGCDDQIIPLRDRNGRLCAVVCAVPFLRDRDIRKAVSGEDVARQQQARKEGILEYYRKICARASELYPDVPLIATGHFYATGGIVSGGKTAGSLLNIAAAELPEQIGYLALGHLHTPQSIGGRENFRYSGSLLRMSFAPGDADKSIPILDTDHLSAPPRLIPVPAFRKMCRITGDMESIRRALSQLIGGNEPAWLSIENTGDFEPALRQTIASCCRDTPLRIISCRNRMENPVIRQRRPHSGKKLTELSPEQLFRTLLKERKLSPERNEALLSAFRETLRAIAEDDVHTE